MRRSDRFFCHYRSLATISIFQNKEAPQASETVPVPVRKELLHDASYEKDLGTQATTINNILQSRNVDPKYRDSVREYMQNYVRREIRRFDTSDKVGLEDAGEISQFNQALNAEADRVINRYTTADKQANAMREEMDTASKEAREALNGDTEKLNSEIAKQNFTPGNPDNLKSALGIQFELQQAQNLLKQAGGPIQEASVKIKAFYAAYNEYQQTVHDNFEIWDPEGVFDPSIKKAQNAKFLALEAIAAAKKAINDKVRKYQEESKKIQDAPGQMREEERKLFEADQKKLQEHKEQLSGKKQDAQGKLGFQQKNLIAMQTAKQTLYEKVQQADEIGRGAGEEKKLAQEAAVKVQNIYNALPADSPERAKFAELLERVTQKQQAEEKTGTEAAAQKQKGDAAVEATLKNIGKSGEAIKALEAGIHYFEGEVNRTQSTTLQLEEQHGKNIAHINELDRSVSESILELNVHASEMSTMQPELDEALKEIGSAKVEMPGVWESTGGAVARKIDDTLGFINHVGGTGLRYLWGSEFQLMDVAMGNLSWAEFKRNNQIMMQELWRDKGTKLIDFDGLHKEAINARQAFAKDGGAFNFAAAWFMGGADLVGGAGKAGLNLVHGLTVGLVEHPVEFANSLVRMVGVNPAALFNNERKEKEGFFHTPLLLEPFIKIGNAFKDGLWEGKEVNLQDLGDNIWNALLIFEMFKTPAARVAKGFKVAREFPGGGAGGLIEGGGLIEAGSGGSTLLRGLRGAGNEGLAMLVDGYKALKSPLKLAREAIQDPGQAGRKIGDAVENSGAGPRLRTAVQGLADGLRNPKKIEGIRQILEGLKDTPGKTARRVERFQRALAERSRLATEFEAQYGPGSYNKFLESQHSGILSDDPIIQKMKKEDPTMTYDQGLEGYRNKLEPYKKALQLEGQIGALHGTLSRSLKNDHMSDLRQDINQASNRLNELEKEKGKNSIDPDVVKARKDLEAAQQKFKEAQARPAVEFFEGHFVKRDMVNADMQAAELKAAEIGKRRAEIEEAESNLARARENLEGIKNIDKDLSAVDKKIEQNQKRLDSFRDKNQKYFKPGETKPSATAPEFIKKAWDKLKQEEQILQEARSKITERRGELSTEEALAKAQEKVSEAEKSMQRIREREKITPPDSAQRINALKNEIEFRRSEADFIQSRMDTARYDLDLLEKKGDKATTAEKAKINELKKEIRKNEKILAEKQQLLDKANDRLLQEQNGLSDAELKITKQTTKTEAYPDDLQFDTPEIQQQLVLYDQLFSEITDVNVLTSKIYTEWLKADQAEIGSAVSRKNVQWKNENIYRTKQLPKAKAYAEKIIEERGRRTEQIRNSVKTDKPVTEDLGFDTKTVQENLNDYSKRFGNQTTVEGLAESILNDWLRHDRENLAPGDTLDTYLQRQGPKAKAYAEKILSDRKQINDILNKPAGQAALDFTNSKGYQIGEIDSLKSELELSDRLIREYRDIDYQLLENLGKDLDLNDFFQNNIQRKSRDPYINEWMKQATEALREKNGQAFDTAMQTIRDYYAKRSEILTEKIQALEQEMQAKMETDLKNKVSEAEQINTSALAQSIYESRITKGNEGIPAIEGITPEMQARYLDLYKKHEMGKAPNYELQQLDYEIAEQIRNNAVAKAKSELQEFDTTQTNARTKTTDIDPEAAIKTDTNTRTDIHAVEPGKVSDELGSKTVTNDNITKPYEKRQTQFDTEGKGNNTIADTTQVGAETGTPLSQTALLAEVPPVELSYPQLVEQARIKGLRAYQDFLELGHIPEIMISLRELQHTLNSYIEGLKKADEASKNNIVSKFYKIKDTLYDHIKDIIKDSDVRSIANKTFNYFDRLLTDTPDISLRAQGIENGLSQIYKSAQNALKNLETSSIKARINILKTFYADMLTDFRMEDIIPKEDTPVHTRRYVVLQSTLLDIIEHYPELKAPCELYVEALKKFEKSNWDKTPETGRLEIIKDAEHARTNLLEKTNDQFLSMKESGIEAGIPDPGNIIEANNPLIEAQKKLSKPEQITQETPVAEIPAIESIAPSSLWKNLRQFVSDTDITTTLKEAWNKGRTTTLEVVPDPKTFETITNTGAAIVAEKMGAPKARIDEFLSKLGPPPPKTVADAFRVLDKKIQDQVLQVVERFVRSQLLEQMAELNNKSFAEMRDFVKDTNNNKTLASMVLEFEHQIPGSEGVAPGKAFTVNFDNLLPPEARNQGIPSELEKGIGLGDLFPDISETSEVEIVVHSKKYGKDFVSDSVQIDPATGRKSFRDHGRYIPIWSGDTVEIRPKSKPDVIKAAA